MSKLPQTLQLNVSLVCYAIVSSNFATFQNPNMRGPSFSWDNFATLMKGRCESGVFLNVPVPEKYTESVRKFAGTAGAEIASYLVKQMTE